MTSQRSRGPIRSDWMTIHEASTLIGVSPATLRRWSDAGEIKAFTTPGGHRRFSRAAVAGMLPADRRGRPNLGQIGETPERMARVYRRELQRTVRLAPWMDEIGEADRAPLRDHGRRIAAALLTFFDATEVEDRGAALATAEASAAECGRIAGRIGLPMETTVETFLQVPDAVRPRARRGGPSSRSRHRRDDRSCSRPRPRPSTGSSPRPSAATSP